MGESDAKQCSNCEYYEAKQGERYGHCKRYAPRPKIDKTITACQPVWPIVQASWWCGEFKQATDTMKHQV
jgi:hypothetical protein